MNLKEVTNEILIRMYYINSKHIAELYLEKKNIEEEINKRVEILRIRQEGEVK